MRTLLKLAPKRGSMMLRTADGNGEPPGTLTRVEDGAGIGAEGASARCMAFFAAPFCAVGAGLGGSRMRMTFLAVSSASSSAGSFGLETGRRVVLENWMDGCCAALIAGS